MHSVIIKKQRQKTIKIEKWHWHAQDAEEENARDTFLFSDCDVFQLDTGKRSFTLQLIFKLK